ncbi:hypothetical protein DH2020_020886 [Rehmannia glutinosa]|uniref:Ubiquitin carboxyl-terminal hydrolase n=1 Tax=Rehmannia glutinosa TaxID=99300 RepID=A0ABR0W8T5_REHGL
MSSIAVSLSLSSGIVSSRRHRFIVDGPLSCSSMRSSSSPASTANAVRLPSSVKSTSDLDVAFVEENGCTASTYPGGSGAKELNPGHIECPASVSYDSAHNLSKQTTLEPPGIHSLSELSSSLESVVLGDSANGVHRMESNKSIFEESNGPNVIPRTFLPRGLVNLGNLCFLNATLQSLLSCSPFFELLHELRNRDIPKMHDELLKLDAQVSNGNGKTASLVSSTDDESEDENWETVGPRNKTAITRTQSFVPSKLSAIFGGQLRSVVKARGNKASATVQPFLLLHLNICPEPVCTIEDALQLFSAPETLEGYRTSASGKAEVVTASKSVKILELSEIMILHLMRFSYGSQGSTKLHKTVHFPLELLVGRELLSSPSSEGKKYQLVATITHHGKDPSKGHYTADARHPNGTWLRYDDASVTPIPESKVLHDQAYVLFYKQL